MKNASCSRPRLRSLQTQRCSPAQRITQADSCSCPFYLFKREICAGCWSAWVADEIQRELHGDGVHEGDDGLRQVFLCPDGGRQGFGGFYFREIYLVRKIIVFCPLFGHSLEQSSLFIPDYLDAAGKQNGLSWLQLLLLLFGKFGLARPLSHYKYIYYRGLYKHYIINIVSYSIIPYHIRSYLILSDHILSYLILFMCSCMVIWVVLVHNIIFSSNVRTQGSK